jgi:pimeloyl-ACP methyl ester carboxylesterase
MINYYRESVRQSPHAEAQVRPIPAPTLVIWGQGDRYFGPELAEPDRVTQLLIDFFAPALPTENR